MSKPSRQLSVKLCESLGHLLHVGSLGVGDVRSAVGKAESGIAGCRTIVQVFVNAPAGERVRVRGVVAKERG